MTLACVPTLTAHQPSTCPPAPVHTPLPPTPPPRLGANDVGNSLRGDPTQLPDVIQATAECLVRNVTTLAATRSFAVVYIAMLPPLERYPTVIAEATPTQLLQVAGVVNGANAAYGAALTQLGAALAAKLGSAAPKLRVIDTTTVCPLAHAACMHTTSRRHALGRVYALSVPWAVRAPLHAPAAPHPGGPACA